MHVSRLAVVRSSAVVAIVLGTLALPPPASAATICRSVSACLFEENTSTGFGVEGVSAANNGVVGFTYRNATKPSEGKSGVSGYDASTNNNAYNSGVYGYSPNAVGVHGKSLGGIGVGGESTSGFGVSGTSSTGYGVNGTSTNFVGVQGSSPNFAGVGGFSEHGGGVLAQSGNGYGLEASSNGYIAVLAESSDLSYETGAYAVYAIRKGYGSVILAQAINDKKFIPPPDIFIGVSDNKEAAKIDYYGNLTVGGTITSGTRNQNGEEVATYAERSSTPTIDDIGSGELMHGTAFVPLDSAFAATIDRAADYLVLVTPRGESKGLYVAHTSAQGFVVRENGGGHSTLSFDYRLVARPYGAQRTRLPALSLQLSGKLPALKRTEVALPK